MRELLKEGDYRMNILENGHYKAGDKGKGFANRNQKWSTIACSMTVVEQVKVLTKKVKRENKQIKGRKWIPKAAQTSPRIQCKREEECRTTKIHCQILQNRTSKCLNH